MIKLICRQARHRDGAQKKGGETMKLWKMLVLTTLFVLWVSPVFAEGDNPPEADTMAVAEYGEKYSVDEAAESVRGSCSGCSGWVWAHALEAWRYVSGSEERIWLYFRESSPSNLYADTGDARHVMFLQGAASAHWLATYWTSSTTISNVRLWYY